MTCQCFRFRSSYGFWSYPLSPGLAISVLVCLDFAFHLLSYVISFSWRHLHLAFAHVQTISTSSLWFNYMDRNCTINSELCYTLLRAFINGLPIHIYDKIIRVFNRSNVSIRFNIYWMKRSCIMTSTLCEIEQICMQLLCVVHCICAFYFAYYPSAKHIKKMYLFSSSCSSNYVYLNGYAQCFVWTFF